MKELLAPCGDTETYYAAVNAGADAVYLGLTDFSARKSAANFTPEQLSEVLFHARVLGVKVYVAVNTLIKQSELPAFFAAVERAYLAGADAFILQDIFLGRTLKARFPDIALHLSTQAGVCDANGAAFAAECGFSRVILARETSMEDIREVASIVETECFVQGALCTCFSGHCYMSSFAGGNSGNRGLCKQPCRRKYRISARGADGREKYAVSLSDLSVGRDISRLIAAGVSSFKIEGRMRRPEYVAAAVRYYRLILDGAPAARIEEARSALMRTYNRGGLTRGLAFGQDETFISDKVQGHIGEKIGIVRGTSAGTHPRVTVCSDHLPSRGDAFKILRGGEETGACFVRAEGKGKAEVSASERFDKGVFVAELSGDAAKGDEVYITTDAALSARLLGGAARKRKIGIALSFAAGQKANAVVCADGRSIEVASDDVFPAAERRPATEEEIAECFRKTDGMPAEAELTLSAGGIFAPKALLNAFRRKVYREAGERLFAPPVRRVVPEYSQKPAYNHITMHDINKSKITVISDSFSSFGNFVPDRAVFSPNDYGCAAEYDKFFAGAAKSKEKYLFLPAFAGKKAFALTEPFLSRFDGIYADGIGPLAYALKRGMPVFAGTGLNVFNAADAEELENRDVKFCFSKELSRAEIAEIEGAFAPAKRGAVFSLGRTEVMELLYCPLGKTCSDCRAEDVFSLVDYAGRAFPVRRVKAGDCRFVVYNESELLSLKDGENAVYCFSGLPAGATAKICRALSERKGGERAAELRAALGKTTGGHLARGIE